MDANARSRSVFSWELAGLAALGVASAVVLGIAFIPQPKTPVAGPSITTAASAPDTSAASTPAPAGIPKAPKVFFSGDSLSESWYSTTEAQGFRPVVQAAILAARPAATFSGTYQAGYRVQDIADSFEIPAGNDVVVIELGTNDVLRVTDPAIFVEQYSDYVATVNVANPNATLTCLGSFYFEAPQSAAIDEAIKSVCEQNGGRYVDLTATYEAEGTRGPQLSETWLGVSDDFHPNDTGHEQIAGLVLASISM